MRDPFLRPDRDNGLSLRIEVYIVVALVPSGDRMAKARDTARGGVAMVLAVPSDFDQFIDDVRRGRLIGIPHSEINDVFPTMPSLQFQSLDLRKHIGRQPL